MTRQQVTVFAVGGTGESFPGDRRTRVTGMLAGVTAELDDRFTCRWVGYPASYGPVPRLGGMSFTESVQAGVDELTRLVEDSSGPVMLIGYSQGAVVVRTFLAAPGVLGNGRIRAAGLIADPHQPAGVVPGCEGTGVAGPGPRLPTGLPMFWIGSPEDMICNAEPDSIIRDAADLTDALGVRALRRWLSEVGSRLRGNRMQNAAHTRIAPAQWRRDVSRWRSAVVAVLGYLPAVLRILGVRLRNVFGGRHTSYLAEPYHRATLSDPAVTGCQVLARRLQVEATLADRRVA